MATINIRDLSFGAKARICWSFFWRGIVMTVGSMLTGAILGGLFGAILGFGVGAAGLSPQSIKGVGQILALAVGIGIGFLFLYIYIRWLLSSRLGNYRLVLVSAEDTSDRSFQGDRTEPRLNSEVQAP